MVPRPRREPLARLRERGLRLRSDFGDLDLSPVRAVADAAEIDGPVDAVLFSVKAYDDDAMADTIAPVVRRRTSITSVQNGVESGEFLRGAVPGRGRSSAAWPGSRDGRKAPGEFHQRGPNNKLVVGAFRPEDRPAVDALGAAFAGTPVVFEASDDIRVGAVVQDDEHLLRRRGSPRTAGAPSGRAAPTPCCGR